MTSKPSKETGTSSCPKHPALHSHLWVAAPSNEAPTLKSRITLCTECNRFNTVANIRSQTVHHGNKFSPSFLFSSLLSSFFLFIKYTSFHLAWQSREEERRALEETKMNRIKTFFTYRYRVILCAVVHTGTLMLLSRKTQTLSCPIARGNERIGLVDEWAGWHCVYLQLKGETITHRSSWPEECETHRWDPTANESLFTQPGNDCSTGGSISSRNSHVCHRFYLDLECLHQWHASWCRITSMLIVCRQCQSS